MVWGQCRHQLVSAGLQACAPNRCAVSYAVRLPVVTTAAMYLYVRHVTALQHAWVSCGIHNLFCKQRLEQCCNDSLRPFSMLGGSQKQTEELNLAASTPSSLPVPGSRTASYTSTGSSWLKWNVVRHVNLVRQGQRLGCIAFASYSSYSDQTRLQSHATMTYLHDLAPL